MSIASLPPHRTDGPYRIAVVCLGNICRSPVGGVVLAHRVQQAGLGERVIIDSAGTADWHVGKPMDPRSAATLTAAGYDPTQHRARHFDADWLDRYDLVLAMDRSNLADITGLTTGLTKMGPADHVRLFGDFDPQHPGGEVPDPYYGGPEGFDLVLAMVERTAATIVDALAEELIRP